MTDTFLEAINSRIGDDNFKFWFKTSKFEIQDNNIIKIITPNLYIKTILKEKYLNIMREVYEEINNGQVIKEFIFKIQEPLKEKPEELILTAPNEGAGSLKEEPVVVPKPIPLANTNLNSKYTFDKFVVGDNNQFAQAAAFAVAKVDEPGKQFNPLFIYGGVGLGKTHLMQAIGHYVLENFKNLRVLYMTSEEFTNDFINALSQKKTKSFREKYRHIDFLLIDDIQFLAGKEQMQEEFFHTFNTLYSSQKQLVISSDRPPRELSSLEDRLKSRFECGLQADISPPKYETRVAILKKLCEEFHIILNDDVVDFIATNIKSNIRELEGAFNKITAYAKVMEVDITLELTKNILKDIIPNTVGQKNISCGEIINKVSKYFEVDVPLILSDKKTKHIANARQIAMYLCRDLTDSSYKKIGREFGKDHSTIVYAYEKLKTKINNDINILNLINELKKIINNGFE